MLIITNIEGNVLGYVGQFNAYSKFVLLEIMHRNGRGNCIASVCLTSVKKKA